MTTSGAATTATPTLGLRANLGQFSLLVVVNAVVGAMIGMERSILPAIAEQEFKIAAHAAVLSFPHAGGAGAGTLSQREVFARTSLTDRDLSSVSQAGLVNNLNDGMAWGLFPMFFAGARMTLERIGWLAAIYPAVWGVGQLFTGALSDRIGRKWLIASGMWVQAVGIVVIVLSSSFVPFSSGGVLLGAGTAMVYPTLLAAIADVAHYYPPILVVGAAPPAAGQSHRRPDDDRSGVRHRHRAPPTNELGPEGEELR